MQGQKVADLIREIRENNQLSTTVKMALDYFARVKRARANDLTSFVGVNPEVLDMLIRQETGDEYIVRKTSGAYFVIENREVWENSQKKERDAHDKRTLHPCRIPKKAARVCYSWRSCYLSDRCSAAKNTIKTSEGLPCF